MKRIPMTTYSRPLSSKGTRKGRKRPKVSAYKGVSRFRNGTWYARVSKNDVKRTLGIFQTEIQAAR